MSVRRQDPARLAGSVGSATRLSHVLSMGMSHNMEPECPPLAIGCGDYSCDMHDKAPDSTDAPTASKSGNLDWLVSFNPQDVDQSFFERAQRYADIKDYDIPSRVATNYDGPTLYARALEGGGTVAMPRAMWNLYNQILDGSAYMSPDKTSPLVDKSYDQNWDSRPNGLAPQAPYTTPGPGAAGLKIQLGAYAEIIKGLKWKTKAFYEAVEWTPQKAHLENSKT